MCMNCYARTWYCGGAVLYTSSIHAIKCKLANKVIRQVIKKHLLIAQEVIAMFDEIYMYAIAAAADSGQSGCAIYQL